MPLFNFSIIFNWDIVSLHTALLSSKLIEKLADLCRRPVSTFALTFVGLFTVFFGDEFSTIGKSIKVEIDIVLILKSNLKYFLHGKSLMRSKI